MTGQDSDVRNKSTPISQARKLPGGIGVVRAHEGT